MNKQILAQQNAGTNTESLPNQELPISAKTEETIVSSVKKTPARSGRPFVEKWFATKHGYQKGALTCLTKK